MCFKCTHWVFKCRHILVYWFHTEMGGQLSTHFLTEVRVHCICIGTPSGPLGTTPRTIKGAQKLLRGLQQEAQVCSFSEVHFSQLFLDLCDDSRDHIFGPNTKCHTILESLRQVCFSPKKLIDLRGQLRPPAASKGFSFQPSWLFSF